MTPWPFSRNKNMTEPNVMGFLRNPVRAGANDAAEASTLQDFGFWDMGKWKPTPVAEALLSKKITWPECALLQMSKRSAFRVETEIKPLVLVAKVLDLLLSLGIDELWVRDCQDYLYDITSYAQVDGILLNKISKAHEQQRKDKKSLSGDYIDIWFNAFCETGLFIKTRVGLKIASGENMRAIVSYIARYGERISISPVKVRGNDAKAFYDYMGSLTTGIVEILPPLFCVEQIPGLMKLAGAEPPMASLSTTEPLKEDRLTIALKMFKDARKVTASTGVRYWVFSPGEQANRWDEMRNGGVMALSYEECGRDLREYVDEEAIRATFKSSEEDDASYKNHIRALTDFLNVMKPGDLVFAKKGTKTFLGVGRVMGEYEFAADASDYKHRRAVEWLKAETIEREDAVARKTLTDVTRYDDLVRELCEAYGIADSDSNGGAAWSAYWELNPWARQYFDELRKNIDKLDKDKVVEMFTGVKENGKVVFKPMWSGSNGTGWNSLKRGLEEESSKTIDAIRSYCASAADLAVFATKEDGKNRPLGFGNSVVSELLMKFHPDVAMKCGRKTIAVYHDLKLMEFKRPDDYSATEYTKALGIAADIRQRMDQLEITRMVEDNKPADYLTVNEFIAWCGDHKDLIKEEIMKQNQIKAEPEKLKTDGKKKLSDLIAGGPDSLMTMLTAALLAKPFAILAGASGTGKSRMVKKLAYMTCNADQLRSEKDETPGNYCMVAVKPNWHDSSELLGYRSAISESHEYVTPDFIKFILRAHAFPRTPFFVCLDEMNLAPVEQYFAEFLSACESIRRNTDGEWVSDPLIQPGEFDKNVANLAPDYSLPDACIKRINERGLYIPHNLFVVGTVNMDDTTHQFSRKVLDRAMTLMMDDVDFGTLQDAQYEKLTNDLLMNGKDIEKFIDRGEFEGKDLEKDFKELLGKLQAALKESPFAIGYRFAIESVLYRKALALLGIEVAALDATAADHMALMKILPRITGTLEERDAVLKNLADFFGAIGEHKQSGDRLEKMKTAARQNGDYISFWP